MSFRFFTILIEICEKMLMIMMHSCLKIHVVLSKDAHEYIVSFKINLDVCPSLM